MNQNELKGSELVKGKLVEVVMCDRPYECRVIIP